MAINNPIGQTFSITFGYHLFAECDNNGTNGIDPNYSYTYCQISIDNGFSWTTIDSVEASVIGGSPTPQYDSKIKEGTYTIYGITNIPIIRLNGSVQCDIGLNYQNGSVTITLDYASVNFGNTSIICNNKYDSSCVSGNANQELSCGPFSPPTTTTTTTIITGLGDSEIYFGSFGSSVATMAINNPVGQTFSVTFYYTIYSTCDNVGTDGEDQNQSTTMLYISRDGGVTYTFIDDVYSSVSGGNFPIGQSDEQSKIGTYTMYNVTDITLIKVTSVFPCDWGANARTGSIEIKIDAATVNFGTTTIICPDTYFNGCGMDMEGINCIGITTTTSTTLGPITTTTTTTIPPTTTTTTTINLNKIPIIPPQGVSPNGDGINDVFFIKNLQYFPKTQLYVYTRAGIDIYTSTDYLNNWGGKNIKGEQVPAGIYYYILTLGITGRVIQGFVYIKYVPG